MIQKLTVELNVNDTEEAKRLQKEIVSLINKRIRYSLDKIFKELSPDQTFFIPKIVIDLGEIKGSNYLAKFESKFLLEVRKQIQNKISNLPVKSKEFIFTKFDEVKKTEQFKEAVSIPNSDFFALQQYLLAGYFPWWIDTKTIEIEELILEHISKSPNSFSRFIFSDSKTENRVKQLRLFNSLSPIAFEKTFNKLVQKRYFSQVPVFQPVLQKVKKYSNPSQFKKVMLKFITEFTPSKDAKKTSKFVEIIIKSIHELPSVTQVTVLSEILTTIPEFKSAKLKKVVTNEILKLEKPDRISSYLPKYEARKKEVIKFFISYLKRKSTPPSQSILANIKDLEEMLFSIINTFSNNIDEKTLNSFLRKNVQSFNNTLEYLQGIRKFFDAIKADINRSSTVISAKKTFEVQIKEAQLLVDKTQKQLDKAIVTQDELNSFTKLEEVYEQTETTKKQLSFELFSFDFLMHLLTLFLTTGVFPPWSEKLLLSVKSAKKLKTEFQLASYILTLLYKQSPDILYPKLSELFFDLSVAQTAVATFPVKLLDKIREVLYHKHQEYFSEMMKYANSSEVSKNEVEKVLILSFKSISTEIVVGNIAVLKNEIKNTLLEKNELSLETVQKTLEELILDGKLSTSSFKIEIQNIQKYASDLPVFFYKTLFINQQARLNFINLLPESLITRILQHVLGDLFSFIDEVWKEVNFIFSQTKLSSRQLRLVKNQFYLIAIEIFVQGLVSEKVILQKYFASVTEFLNRIGIREIFSELLEKATRSSRRDKIKLFKNYETSLTPFFITEIFSDNYLTEKVEVLSFQFLYYLKTGRLHWSFPYQNILKFSTLIANNQYKIIRLIHGEVEKLLSSSIIMQRLYIIIGKNRMKNFIESISELQGINSNIDSENTDKEQSNKSKGEDTKGDKIVQDKIDEFEKLTDLRTQDNLINEENIIQLDKTRTVDGEGVDDQESIDRDEPLFVNNQGPEKKLVEDIELEKVIEENKAEKEKELIDLFPDYAPDEIFEQIMDDKVDWVNQPEEEERIYVNNVGLVILCNFLSFLFKRTKLIKRKGKKHLFVDDHAQQRAIHLLQYIVTGKEQHKEHELVLNKLICGLELKLPVDMSIKLTEKEKQEAELLLNSVISHWKILGNISFEGLRESFLVREGVISFKNRVYSIKAEQKAIDILMKKLPWSFQTIKLSWNSYLLTVDWNS